MTLHFAYGSNMSRPLMAVRCPQARALGLATLSGWRFIINSDGLASLVPQKGGRVHGVLWQLSARDVAAINAYEDLASGLYVSRLLPVQVGERHANALVYLARRRGKGIPRPAYLQLVIEAALDWNLPQPYIRSITRWSPSRWRGTRAKETGELK
jgi:cation transport regulator ChaC